MTVWQEAMKLVEAVYQQTESFPGRETFVLAAQIRRSAVSVPSNIAEGSARNSSREFFHHLGIATGSLAELETQVELASRLGYLASEPDLLVLISRAGRLLHALRSSLRDRARVPGHA